MAEDSDGPQEAKVDEAVTEDWGLGLAYHKGYQELVVFSLIHDTIYMYNT